MQLPVLRFFSQIAVATLLGLVAVPAASAQDGPSAGDQARAREHFEKGSELASDGKCDEAIEHFETGYELSERPLFLFNAAECARKVGRSELARQDYRSYLEQEPDGQMAQTARQRLEELGGAEEAEADPEPEATSGEAQRAEAQRAPTPAETAAASDPADVSADPSATPSDDAGTRRPLWKRWPLWAGVGAAVVAAVVVPVAVRQTGGNGASCGGNCQVVDFDGGM